MRKLFSGRNAERGVRKIPDPLLCHPHQKEMTGGKSLIWKTARKTPGFIPPLQTTLPFTPVMRDVEQALQQRTAGLPNGKRTNRTVRYIPSIHNSANGKLANSHWNSQDADSSSGNLFFWIFPEISVIERISNTSAGMRKTNLPVRAQPTWRAVAIFHHALPRRAGSRSLRSVKG